MMNRLDRTIAWLSPARGLARARARAATGIVARAYDGAARGRGNDGWTSTGGSANAEVAPALARLRSNARELVRNNPLARRAVNVLVANIVGTGILPSALGRSAKSANKAFGRWARRCDADGRLDYYGLQALAVRTAILSGESLTVRRPQPLDRMPASTVPLQLQVLEGDHLDLAKTEVAAGGNYILQGIEFDGAGARVAYWLFDQHPGDQHLIAGKWGLTSRRVPAADVIHLYRVDRPGQLRGVPWFDAVITTMRDWGEYEEAERVRKKIEACVVALVTQPGGPEGPSLGGVGTGSTADKRAESFEPAMIEYLNPGEDVKFNNPPASGGYAEYNRVQARTVAAGVDVMYEHLTGDLSGVNYSSFRAGDLMSRTLVEVARWHMVIPVWCEPTWAWFAHAGRIAGLVGDEGIESEWMPPRFQSVDPGKDALADLLEIRMGTKTIEQAIAERGYDPTQQLERVAQVNALIDKLGLILDGDPRHQARSGNRASAPATAEPQPATEG